MPQPAHKPAWTIASSVVACLICFPSTDSRSTGPLRSPGKPARLYANAPWRETGFVGRRRAPGEGAPEAGRSYNETMERHYRRNSAVTERAIDDAVFLASPESEEIIELNPMGTG